MQFNISRIQSLNTLRKTQLGILQNLLKPPKLIYYLSTINSCWIAALYFLGYMLDSDLFADIPSNCDDSGAFSENGFEQSRVIWEIEGETSKRNRKIVSVPICSQFNPNSSLLSSDVPFFSELGYMLDLCNHDKICRLLPYLLTAYVCHANKNSFKSNF